MYLLLSEESSQANGPAPEASIETKKPHEFHHLYVFTADNDFIG